jgi:hypothetical protein
MTLETFHTFLAYGLLVGGAIALVIYLARGRRR